MFGAVYNNQTQGLLSFNTLETKQNWRHFAADILMNFLVRRFFIVFKITQHFVPKCPTNNMTTLIQIMEWLNGPEQATSHYLNQW